jgi:predicted nucleotidyltransferase
MITKKQLNNVIKIIVSHYKPQKIILFGSFADGSQTKESDVDLLIIKDDNLPKIKRNRIVRSLLKDLIIPVDIIVKTNEEYEMYKEIIGTVVYAAHKYGKVVYG